MKTQMRHNSRNKLRYTKKNKLNIKNLKKTKRTKRCQRGSGKKEEEEKRKEERKKIVDDKLNESYGIKIDNDFLCNYSKEIAENLKTNKGKVKYITFDINNCTNKNKLKDITDVLSNNENNKIDSISINNISNIEDIKIIAEFINNKTNQKITKLNLLNNNLDKYINETNISGTSGTSLIFDALLKNPNNGIKTLQISGYPICNKCIDSIVEYLKTNPKLESLSIGETSLNNEDIKKILNSLNNNTNLKDLYLGKQININKTCQQAILKNKKNNKQISFFTQLNITNTSKNTIEEACTSLETSLSQTSSLSKRPAPSPPSETKKKSTDVIYDLGNSGYNNSKRQNPQEHVYALASEGTHPVKKTATAPVPEYALASEGNHPVGKSAPIYNIASEDPYYDVGTAIINNRTPEQKAKNNRVSKNEGPVYSVAK